MAECLEYSLETFFPVCLNYFYTVCWWFWKRKVIWA